ncbi:hypothetical protein P8A18_14745 [Streptomyces castrisilvae]|uniref:Uncharacterized protein n=1 Tax=Streptomyces castrisilvae TaxID=3033811 RepID=A0ABY9HJF0_9ACTN|nr:hypothetical protein [Streptomyces sp. Mut1]WLQ34615.1 hypothetical protein P8A18_14745 [Streptomyces sp. Mut1]
MVLVIALVYAGIAPANTQVVAASDRARDFAVLSASLALRARLVEPALFRR